MKRYENFKGYGGVRKLLRFFEELRENEISNKLLTLCCLTGGPKKGQMQAFYWTDILDGLNQKLYVVGDGKRSAGSTARLTVDLLDNEQMKKLNYDPMAVVWYPEREDSEKERQIRIRRLQSFEEPVPYDPIDFITRLKKDIPELS